MIVPFAKMLFANPNNVRLVVTYFVGSASMTGKEKMRNIYHLSLELVPATVQETQSHSCRPELSSTSTMILTSNALHVQKWLKWVIYQRIRKSVEELNASIQLSAQATKIRKLKPKNLYAPKNVNFFLNSCKFTLIVGKLKETPNKCMNYSQSSHPKSQLPQINS